MIAAYPDLAEELGDFPLALEQAGAYIEATGQTFSGYSALFSQHSLTLLEQGAPATDYQATAEVTARLLQDLHCADETALWQKLRIDKRQTVEPQPLRRHHPQDPQADLWGIRTEG